MVELDRRSFVKSVGAALAGTAASTETAAALATREEKASDIPVQAFHDEKVLLIENADIEGGVELTPERFGVTNEWRVVFRSNRVIGGPIDLTVLDDGGWAHAAIINNVVYGDADNFDELPNPSKPTAAC